jgi:oligo-1,6-glucosidase
MGGIKMEKLWWQHRNIYQIYLRSFFDANNDGIGDIEGVTKKLGYLKDLGIGIIWISPHYDSPMDDNGYDVRDFYQVSKDYGTLEQFKTMVEVAHSMDIKIITDLVLNHTSDEHLWFKAAKDPSHPDHLKYHDYYIWQPPKYDASGKRQRPTRWIGWFGSPAWDYNPETDEYYLHIFSKKMPDLNWHNRNMVDDLKTMIKWWLELGIDGFRVDASNHLEKNWNFPDTFPGYENFSSIPKHHEYLQELGRDLFVPYDVLTIGESGGATQEEALKYAGYGSNEFNMLIQFGHCWADIDNHHPKLMGKWAQGTLNLTYIKKSFKNWYDMLYQKGWNVIYWHNHDQPRVVSHYGDDGQFHQASAKMLAMALNFMPGSAICYQGEEIGMTNVLYQDISQFRDVEVFTEYQNMLESGLSEAEALAVIKARCRDNARTPMQWNSNDFAGFTTVEPWIDVNANYPSINVERQDKNPVSILNTYRKILKLRLSDINITDGHLEYLDIESLSDYSYLNSGVDREYLVLCNFREHPLEMTLDIENLKSFEYVMGNYEPVALMNKQLTLRPFETHVFSRIKS